MMITVLAVMSSARQTAPACLSACTHTLAHGRISRSGLEPLQLVVQSVPLSVAHLPCPALFVSDLCVMLYYAVWLCQIYNL